MVSQFFITFFSVITNPWTGEPINVANEGNDENSAHDGKSEFLDILTFSDGDGM